MKVNKDLNFEVIHSAEDLADLQYLVSSNTFRLSGNYDVTDRPSLVQLPRGIDDADFSALAAGSVKELPTRTELMRAFRYPQILDYDFLTNSSSLSLLLLLLSATYTQTQSSV